jgi:hypothetical protein
MHTKFRVLKPQGKIPLERRRSRWEVSLGKHVGVFGVD